MVSVQQHSSNFHMANEARLTTNTSSVNAYDSTNADQWEAYRSYRPQYPVSLFQRIYTYHIINGGTFDGTAHDAGCGPGITAGILSLQFKQVICSDFSQTAIDSAKTNLLGSSQKPCKSFTNSNFTFKLSSAEDMSWITPGTIDMITMSEALHWTDTTRTIAAAAQALKPNGTFAAWYYTQPRFPDNPAIESIFRDLQSLWCKLRRDFSQESERTLWVEQSGYDCVAFPSDTWDEVTRIKVNTSGNKNIWVRDDDLCHVRSESQVSHSDQVEYIENAKDWQQQVDLDWIRGWFESLFPTVDTGHLNDTLRKLEAAYGAQKSVRAVWPVVILLASRKG
jgi:SAM-dependent methyltransferase